MAYQTGSASDKDNLMDIVATFALSNGWSGITASWPITNNEDCHINWGGGSRSLADHTNYGGSSVSKEDIQMHLGTSQPGAAPGNWWEMPGGLMTSNNSGQEIICYDAGVSGLANGSEPYVAYHLFNDGTAPNYIHLAMQLTSQHWQHLSFGNVQQHGMTHAGVGYASGAAMTPWLISTGTEKRCNALGSASNEILFGSPVGDGAGLAINTVLNITDPLPAGFSGNSTVDISHTVMTYGSLGGNQYSNGNNAYGPGSHMWQDNPIPVSGKAQLHTCPCFISKQTSDSTTNEFVYVGDYPDIRLTRMVGINAGDEITFGGDTWKVFPYMRKTAIALYNGAGNITSGDIGIAYKKVV